MPTLKEGLWWQTCTWWWWKAWLCKSMWNQSMNKSITETTPVIPCQLLPTVYTLVHLYHGITIERLDSSSHYSHADCRKVAEGLTFWHAAWDVETWFSASLVIRLRLSLLSRECLAQIIQSVTKNPRLSMSKRLPLCPELGRVYSWTLIERTIHWVIKKCLDKSVIWVSLSDPSHDRYCGKSLHFRAKRVAYISKCRYWLIQHPWLSPLLYTFLRSFLIPWQTDYWRTDLMMYPNELGG